MMWAKDTDHVGINSDYDGFRKSHLKRPYQRLRSQLRNRHLRLLDLALRTKVLVLRH
jgi:hypothetical protein